MKILILLFQVTEALNPQPNRHQRQVNSVKDLPATVQTLVTAIKSGTQAPTAFLPKKERATEKQIKRANDSFLNVKGKLGAIQSLASWDTLTYRRDNIKMMDLNLVFNPANDSGVVMVFRVNGNRLLMSHVLRLTPAEYGSHIIEVIGRDRRDELYRQYNHYVFDDPNTTAIPFQSKGLWGLISLDGKVLVPARYDSISKPEDGYYRVVTKDGYNFLDKDLKPVFDKPRKSNGTYERYILPGDQDNSSGPPGKKHTKYNTTSGDEILVETRTPAKFMLSVTSDTLKVISLDDSLINRVALKDKGKIIFNGNDTGKYVARDYELIYNSTSHLFGVYSVYNNVLIQPQYRYVLQIGAGRYFIVVTRKGKLGYLDANGKELF
ncbi:MAG: WG repeat-containing protein [Bacteroidota bacterium]